jgi:hypothetical protein
LAHPSHDPGSYVLAFGVIVVAFAAIRDSVLGGFRFWTHMSHDASKD